MAGIKPFRVSGVIVMYLVWTHRAVIPELGRRRLPGDCFVSFGHLSTTLAQSLSMTSSLPGESGSGWSRNLSVYLRCNPPQSTDLNLLLGDYHTTYGPQTGNTSLLLHLDRTVSDT
jgi:hypothetical protein